MADPKELRAWAGFGTSLESAYLLAAHPDEELEPDGLLPSSTRRTFVLQLRSGKPTFVETVDAPLARAWCSTNGTAYCTVVRQGYMLKFASGKWEREAFSDKPEDTTFVWGVSGSEPDRDVVYVCAKSALFVREATGWKENPVPSGTQSLLHAHGLAPEEVYVCGDPDLLLWNGNSLGAVERPGDMMPKSVCVVSEREMIAAGAKRLYTWSEPSGWDRVDTKFKGFRTALRFGDSVYAGTPRSGVLRIWPGDPTKVTEDFNCLRLFSLGNGILAVGKSVSHLYDGSEWTQIPMPSCPAGGTPGQ
jgi:hypothetical protein